jgi:hypothetical protein
VLFYVLFFTVISGNYWWAVLTIAIGWALSSAIGYLAPLKRIGTKAFRL